MLILKALSLAPMHGYAIAQHLRQISDEVLHVEEGSLYPALQRLLAQRWVRAAWRESPTNRRARYYTITALGTRQLGSEVSSFQRMATAIHRVLKHS